MLIRRKELAALYEIRQAGALVIAAHAHGSKEELKSMILALDKAEERFDNLKEEK